MASENLSISSDLLVISLNSEFRYVVLWSFTTYALVMSCRRPLKATLPLLLLLLFADVQQWVAHHIDPPVTGSLTAEEDEYALIAQLTLCLHVRVFLISDWIVHRPYLKQSHFSPSATEQHSVWYDFYFLSSQELYTGLTVMNWSDLWHVVEAQWWRIGFWMRNNS